MTNKPFSLLTNHSGPLFLIHRPMYERTFRVKDSFLHTVIQGSKLLISWDPTFFRVLKNK